MHTRYFIRRNGKIFCYNNRVPSKWDVEIFDIGFQLGRIRSACFAKLETTGPIAWEGGCSQLPPRLGQNLGRVAHLRDRMVGRVAPRPPGSLSGTASRAVRLFEELWKRARRPQQVPHSWRKPRRGTVRNSVLGFVAKPLTFHNEKLNTMVRRVSFTRRTLFSCFSLRFLAAPATRRNFEGSPLLFSCAEAAAPD